MAINITSTAFEYGAKIPVVHTCDGDDLSPRLRWDGEPKETVTFALIVEDPDAPGGTFYHWVAYNIPKDRHELEKIIPKGKHLDDGTIQTKNDFGKVGYHGPCPPGGSDHRYFFRMFALKKKLLPEGINSAEDLYKAMEGYVLDKGEYMGTYYRKT